MTKSQADQATAEHFADCNGWALKVIEAAFYEQRAKETLKLVDKVLPDETA